MTTNTRNTRTARAERSFGLVALVCVAIALTLVALIGHALWAELSPLFDALSTGTAPAEGQIGGLL